MDFKAHKHRISLRLGAIFLIKQLFTNIFPTVTKAAGLTTVSNANLSQSIRSSKSHCVYNPKNISVTNAISYSYVNIRYSR